MGRTSAKALSKRERKRLAKERRRARRRREARIRVAKKVGGLAALLLTVFALGIGGYRWVAGVKVYPPTDITGHDETVPPSHILSEPMPLAMQKHMLEHADGRGQPGVIINYNCEDFPCEPDLVERLAEIVRAYPDFVYLAPFPGMDARIALTRRGRLQVLDEVDEERIRAFIEGR
ncbi:MAG TPA: DUF3105 domain-containing protein [Caldilineae bacterium]|nr:DUF3105 domain-containing protein [Caldilineae bacterium]